jgi:hypothetical protein
MYKYVYGKEELLDNALEIQKQLQLYGFTGAFVVPFYKRERITVDEAISLINSKN